MTEMNPQAPRIPYFKNDPLIVLLLGFVTCGLYLIYWNIKMAEVINAVVEKEAISPLIAIFSGCCFPINLYFYYLVGQNLEVIGRKVNNPTLQDKSVLLTSSAPLEFPLISILSRFSTKMCLWFSPSYFQK